MRHEANDHIQTGSNQNRSNERIRIIRVAARSNWRHFHSVESANKHNITRFVHTTRFDIGRLSSINENDAPERAVGSTTTTTTTTTTTCRRRRRCGRVRETAPHRAPDRRTVDAKRDIDNKAHQSTPQSRQEQRSSNQTNKNIDSRSIERHIGSQGAFKGHSTVDTYVDERSAAAAPAGDRVAVLAHRIEHHQQRTVRVSE
jgi:hypothetical protein